MKTTLMMMVMMFGCEFTAPPAAPADDNAGTRITFVTEFYLANDTLVVTPQYQLFPTPQTSDIMHIEVYAGGVVIYTGAFPYGLAQYKIPWTGTPAIQIVYCFIIKR